ncbi:CRAL/TRIO domain-containing protein [Phthorimaea operculella]|nr:CRAL/TRIO domain-containing protein [Phthorimaea operculella]
MSLVTVREFPLEEEYQKKTGITPEDIRKLREWLKTQPHLPEEYITDLDLILTFHCSARSTEVTKQLLDLHFTLRTLFTNFFKDRAYDAKIEFVTEKVLLARPLPVKSPEGYGVFYVKFLDQDSKSFVFADCLRTGLMRLDLWQYEEGTWPGLLILIDLDNMSLGHLSKLDMQSEAMLVNLKGFHFLNAPAFMDRLMMLLRPFLNKSFMSILQIHQVGSRTLDKYFPIENLPTGTAGGMGKSVEVLIKENVTKMSAAKDYFLQENKKRVTESKRPGRPKTISDIFGGVEGSFKKLDID